MTDYELVKMKLGGVLLEDVSGITFMGWVAGKINGTKVGGMGGNSTLNELTAMIVNPPMGRMSTQSKIEVIRKLEKLGIEIK
jgi:hypothetical protein